MKKTIGVDWCMNADLLDYFEDATKAKINPSKLKLYFNTMNQFDFDNTTTNMQKVILDTLPPCDIFINQKKKFIKITLK